MIVLGAVCNHFHLATLQTKFFDDIGDDLFRRDVRIEKYFRLALIFNFHPAARIIIIRLAAAKLGWNVLFPRPFVSVVIAVLGVERRDRCERTGYAYGIDGNAEQIRLVVFKILAVDDPKDAFLQAKFVLLFRPSIRRIDRDLFAITSAAGM